MPTSPILNLFGRSPIRPLEAHMSEVDLCVKELEPFFDAVLKKEWSKVNSLQKKILSIVHKADHIKHELRLHLPNSLFMPISRSDLLNVLAVQDKLINKAQKIADLVSERQMVIPNLIALQFMNLLKRSIAASNQANIAIHELDELLETGFSGNEIKLVAKIISKLTEIEKDTDQQQVALRHSMISIEQELPPVDAIFLYKIIKWTGELANKAREIGDRLQILVVR